MGLKEKWTQVIRAVTKLVWLGSLLLPAGAPLTQETGELRVAAVVPPRLCLFPARCHSTVPSAVTMVSVEDGLVRYVGSPPSVVRSGDLIIIIF